MEHSFRSLLARGALASVVPLVMTFAVSGTAAAAATSTTYVATGASPGNLGRSCPTAKYATIADGVAAAPAGGAVVVCPGTYNETVAVDKALTLQGRAATIDASGYDNGVLITHSWVKVDGFTIEGATGEGILAMGTPQPGPIINNQQTWTGTPLAHVVISHNVVRGNDQGGPDSGYAECQVFNEIPGDCGEGIHLMSVRDSVVKANLVKGNSGGILLSDEFGPTHGNVITRNVVEDNPFDCGITLASHNAGWDPIGQTTMPSFAGVYDNWIRGNLIQRNGLLGEGAGVLMAAAFPLAASYDNHVVGNTIIGNDLSGVTIHSHPGGGYTNDNVISLNRIGANNKGGDPDAGVFETTGILVYSTDQPIHVTINRNVIFNDHFGVWLSSATVSATMSNNTFHNVAVPVENG